MMPHRPLWICAALVLAMVSCTPAVIRAPTLPAPPSLPPQQVGKAQILMLGDSQISFGAGGPYTQFLSNLGEACSGLPPGYARATTQAIGVRSTALHNWTARSAPDRDTICEVDQTYGVNAGSYGVTSAGLSYVQIGTAEYPYCGGGTTPLKAAAEHMDPDLIILAFLGNATERWQAPGAALRDWQEAERQLPPDLPCMVMTTIPAYMAEENRKRQLAQAALGAAVTASGRCSFVPGITPATLQAIEGRAENFRTDATGRVTDETHPTTASAARFVAAHQSALCTGLRAALTD